ncbi:MAG: RsiV family protein [Clostridia bacterium]|nr:RsiV family protein [Clostridia bacterium]
MNNFDLENLLNEALKPTESPSDELNAKLKQKISKKKIYTVRRRFEISAACAAAVVAAFAIALNVNDDFADKVSNTPILSKISENDVLVSGNVEKAQSSDKVTKNDNTDKELKNSEFAAAGENKERSIGKDTSDKTETQAVKNKNTTENSETIKSTYDKKSGEFIKLPETEQSNQSDSTSITENAVAYDASIEEDADMVTDMAVYFNENSNYTSYDEEIQNDSYPSVASAKMYMGESPQSDSGNGGGGMARSVLAPEEVLPIKINTDDVETLISDSGKKYSVDKQSKDRVSIGSVFEDGFDYNTALYLNISQQMSDEMNTNNIEYNINGKNSFDAITGEEDFYFNNGDMYITFEKGEVAPESYGICEFNVGKVETAD